MGAKDTIDEVKFDDWMARLRRGLLADLNERIRREEQPLVAFEYAIASQLPLHPGTSQMGGLC